MYQAAHTAEPRVVRRLLEQGADCRVRLPDGYTLLHAAAHSAYPEVLRMFLDQGINVNDSANEQKETPLMWAIQMYDSGSADREDKRCLKKIDMLLDNGADVSIKDKYGYTALRWAGECQCPVTKRLKKAMLNSAASRR